MLPYIHSLSAYITKKIYPPSNTSEMIRHYQSEHIRLETLPDVQVAPLDLEESEILKIMFRNSFLLHPGGSPDDPSESEILESMFRDSFSSSSGTDTFADLLKISLESDIISQEMFDFLSDAI